MERRESDVASLVDGDYWEAIDTGRQREIWPGRQGYTPSLYKRAIGFLMTTESQDLSLTDHPKDGAITE